MFGILDRYVGKNVLVAVVVIAICLCLLTALITLVDKMRYIGRGSVDFLFVCKYVGMHMPGFLVTFFPIATLLGGVIGLGLMARNSEIIIMQAGGMSRLNIALSALKSLVPLIIIVLAVSEYIVPPLEKYAEARLTEESTNRKVSVTSSGIWIREGNYFIGIGQTFSDGRLGNLIRYEIEDNRLKSQINARRADYRNGVWVVTNVVEKNFEEGGVRISRRKQEEWHLNLNPDHLGVIGNASNFLTIQGLIDYIRYLENSKQDSSRYRLELYGKLIAPVATVVMLMLALSTVFGPQRSMHMGTRILAGIGLGFGYYVFNKILTPFSLVYGMPPLLGASISTVLFGLLSLLLLRRRA